MQNSIQEIEKWLEQVTDPEIPVLTIRDLGVLRGVEWEGSKLKVTITPTYSGCPAMDTIEQDINQTLQNQGLEDFEIVTSLNPPWTTDWMTEQGRQKLEEFGIAPPARGTANKRALFGKAQEVRCPKCKSEQTHMISLFGSTACKAMYKCDDCLETFDYFKCI